MARRSTPTPGNVLAQPARPVRLPSGPPSSTQVCTCPSRSMRRCGRSPSMSGSKSMISCSRVSMRHCDDVGIRRLKTSRPGRSGRSFRQAWTASSQKRRPAPLPARRPEPPGGPLPWCGRARIVGTVLQQSRHAVAKTIARPAIDRRMFINTLADLAVGDLEARGQVGASVIRRHR